MRASLLIAAAGLALIAAPAAAQSWNDGYGYEYGNSGYAGGYDPQPSRYYTPRWRSNAVPSNFDWRSQLDRPGDYRCDRFWDASRDDCGDRWRDQRRRVSPQARRDYRELAGYRYGDGYGYSRYGHGYRYGGYPRRGYGSAYYGHGSGGTTYEGAYGRPDVVYPGGGYGGYHGGYQGGRDVRRIDWCRATYRSYDPASGYYRAYSGQLVWCG
ncbi:BA14K family protein [Brevundimonas sp.]|uniref:BA14K family protein n=1 Tax=Brevundimonas sp. TaxID=1871086 RepID=UPI003F6EF836